MNYLNDDGYGSRLADHIINGSYYDGVVEEPERETKGLTKAEENMIVKRLIELMTSKRN